ERRCPAREADVPRPATQRLLRWPFRALRRELVVHRTGQRRDDGLLAGYDRVVAQDEVVAVRAWRHAEGVAEVTLKRFHIVGGARKRTFGRVGSRDRARGQPHRLLRPHVLDHAALELEADPIIANNAVDLLDAVVPEDLVIAARELDI